MRKLPEKTEKPWGYEILFALTDNYAGKVLFIKKGHRLSLQYHEVKEETIYLFSGKMLFIYEEKGQMKEAVLNPGDRFHIPPKMKHRMQALENCFVFEVSTPHLEDVVRLQDDYGREDRKK